MHAHAGDGESTMTGEDWHAAADRIAALRREIADTMAEPTHQPQPAGDGRPGSTGRLILGALTGKMEGRTFTELPDFPVRPVLCDNNLSALSPAYQQHIVDRYRAAGVPLLDANSGFEPATFNDEVFARWKPVLRGPWRFGYDEATEGEAVERAFRLLKDVSPRRKQVYTMIGHEPFDVCMDRIRRVIAWGGEPYAQPFIKLNALEKTPAVRHDWSPVLLKRVQRWVNRRAWRYVPFEYYDPNAKTSRSTTPDLPLFAAE